MFEFLEITDDQSIRILEKTAREIWSEHYTPMLGEGQTSYMLDKFLSFDALKKQIGDGIKYYFLRDNGSVLGFFAFEEQGSDLFMSKLYLMAFARGQGAGRAMMDYIKNKAVRLGKMRVTLKVNRNNTGSIAFYEKSGFTCYGEEKLDIGGGYGTDDFLYEFKL